MMDRGHQAQWFQALVLFTEKELMLRKEMKCSSSVPGGWGGDAAAAAGGGGAASAGETAHKARLLFMKRLDGAMSVSFQDTIKKNAGVIALYGLKKHVSVYSNHCVCLVGFALVHDEHTLQWIVQQRSLPMRTLNMSMGFIGHKDIIMAHKVGMSPYLQAHIYVNNMHGHILDQTVAHGVYMSERVIGIHLRKWAVQAKSSLHLWIMLRYTLAGFGGTNIPLLPIICLEQVALSGVGLDGDGSTVQHGTCCLNNVTQCLLAVECTPSSEQYFHDFVRYIQHDYMPSMNKLQEIERVFSEQDREWERFPVIYTERSRELWAMLSTLSSLSLPHVERFLDDQFIPKHNELFSKTPYELALEEASVTVQPVKDFCLYKWGSGDEVNVHWEPLMDRKGYCKSQLESSLNCPSPFLCKNPELSVFAQFRQPLLMDSSDCMCHVYPFTGDSLAFTTIPSTASIAALMVGDDQLSTLMKGQGPLTHMESCIHEVANPLLNISTLAVDVDIEADSKIIVKVRESEACLKQFCSELIENTRKVLQHLETKCPSLTGLTNEVKHLVFRTQPGNRAKEGFHHLIVLPQWVCLQNIQVASALVQLLQITRHCMAMVGEQGVQFDNIYRSSRHPMRLPFQCKSKGNNPLLLIHSDYGQFWDLQNIGSLFMHGQNGPSVGSVSRACFLIEDLSGVNPMCESTEHHKHAVQVLFNRNIIDAHQSSVPSILKRFGRDLNCSSVMDICTLLAKVFTRCIAQKFVDKVNSMGMETSLSVKDIGLKWLADKELMTVRKGCSSYFDVCIAQRHQSLQDCIYYLCIQRQQQTGLIYAVLYEMCFSTNCRACKQNPPYRTGIYAVLK